MKESDNYVEFYLSYLKNVMQNIFILDTHFRLNYFF